VGRWTIANDRKQPFPDRQAGYPATGNLLDASMIHGQQQEVLVRQILKRACRVQQTPQFPFLCLGTENRGRS
jgi:hypothetical protein